MKNCIKCSKRKIEDPWKNVCEYCWNTRASFTYSWDKDDFTIGVSG